MTDKAVTDKALADNGHKEIPMLLTGVINNQAISIPMVCVGDADCYVESIEWWIKKYGGSSDLTLRRVRNNEVIATYQLIREVGSFKAQVIRDMIT